LPFGFGAFGGDVSSLPVAVLTPPNLLAKKQCRQGNDKNHCHRRKDVGLEWDADEDALNEVHVGLTTQVIFAIVATQSSIFSWKWIEGISKSA
jgi:hypothetical protein